MHQILKRHATKLRFGVVGATNTLIDFGLLFICFNFFGLTKISSNIISTSVAFIFSFFANKRYTFKSKNNQNIIREVVLFTIVTLFGLWVIQNLIIHFLTPVFIGFDLDKNLALLVSKLIATGASLVWNYLLYSRVVFKNSSAK